MRSIIRRQRLIVPSRSVSGPMARVRLFPEDCIWADVRGPSGEISSVITGFAALSQRIQDLMFTRCLYLLHTTLEVSELRGELVEWNPECTSGAKM